MQEQSSELLPEDAFLGQFVGAMALESAFRNGLIDKMASGGAMPQSRGAEILGVISGVGNTLSTEPEKGLGFSVDAYREAFNSARRESGKMDSLFLLKTDVA